MIYAMRNKNLHGEESSGSPAAGLFEKIKCFFKKPVNIWSILIASIVLVMSTLFFIERYELEKHVGEAETSESSFLAASPQNKTSITEVICNDPWDAGYLGDDDTWVPTVLNPCAFEYYSRIFAKSGYTGALPASVEFLRDKSVVMIGDSCDRFLMDVICRLPHFTLLRVEVGDPEKYTYDPGFMGTHIFCRNEKLNFTMGSLFTYALNKNMDEEVVLTSHHRPGEPKVTWERVEVLLTSILAKLHITPTLITLNSGYWNLQHQATVNPADKLDARVLKYTEGMHEYMIPTLKRHFPSSHLAFRLSPYAQKNNRLSLARLVGLYNALMTEQGGIWNMPVMDPRMIGLGMYHIYQDLSHQGHPLLLMYMDMVLHRLHDAVLNTPSNKFKAVS